MGSGIYEIRNTLNGHRYIGSAKSIDARWRVHLHHLRHGTSHNAPLQRAWKKYGEHSFSFNVLIKCESKDLILAEQRFIDALKPEYNVLKVAGSSLGRKVSTETREKLRKASTGHVHTAEHRANIGLAQLGTKRSEETREKFRIVNKIRTPESMEKVRLAKIGNKWNIGKHHSDETKAKMSLAKKLFWLRKKDENG